jgi:hypothetical protein
MKVRRLTKSGLDDFSSFIEGLRNGNQSNTPLFLLETDEHSEAINLDLEVGDQTFSSRYEMGVFLVSLFNGQDIQEYLGDMGFWSWFALLWFDQLCPEKNGVPKPSRAYNYILSAKYNHRPRHAIYMTWQLVNRYGPDAKFLLSKEMSTRGEITEQLMARQENLSSEGIMLLASKLYFDNETESFKKGAASRTGAGCVSRYLIWLEQLKLNYDVFMMQLGDLESLLPKEFERFRG